MVGQILKEAAKSLELKDDGFKERFKYQLIWLSKDNYSISFSEGIVPYSRFCRNTNFGAFGQHDIARKTFRRNNCVNISKRKFSIETTWDICREDLTGLSPTNIVRRRYFKKNEPIISMHQLRKSKGN